MKEEYLTVSRKEATKLYKDGKITEMELFYIRQLRDNEYSKAYTEKNREKKIATSRQYYQTHKEEYRNYQREYQKEYRRKKRQNQNSEKK